MTICPSIIRAILDSTPNGEPLSMSEFARLVKIHAEALQAMRAA